MSTETLTLPPSVGTSGAATLDDVIDVVLRRSAVDLAFRNLALTDATAAISLISSEPIPPELNIQFVDNSGSVKLIPLPPIAPGVEGADGILGTPLDGPNPPEITGWLSWSR